MNFWIKKILIGVITVYQTTLSPDHGLTKALFPQGVCRFYPTCSQVTKQAIATHGWRGLWRGLNQLSRCHPL